MLPHCYKTAVTFVVLDLSWTASHPDTFLLIVASREMLDFLFPLVLTGVWCEIANIIDRPRVRILSMYITQLFFLFLFLLNIANS